MSLHSFAGASLLVLSAWPLAAPAADPDYAGGQPGEAAAASPNWADVSCVAGVVTDPAEGSPTGYPCPPGSVPSNTTGSNAPRPPSPPLGTNATGTVGNAGYAGAGGPAAPGTAASPAGAAGVPGAAPTSNIGTPSGMGSTMGMGGMSATPGSIGIGGSALGRGVAPGR